MRSVILSLALAVTAFADDSAALAGQWEQRSGGSTITYRDQVTGSYSAASGNMSRYTFTPDGQYEYAELHQVSTYGCTTHYFGYDRGTYAVNGDRVILTQQQRSLEFKSTCNPSLNSNKNLPLATRTWWFHVERGASGTDLVLSDANGRYRFQRAR